MPLAASPSGFILLLFLLLQDSSMCGYQRTSVLYWSADIQKAWHSVIASFSVATRYGGLIPFQSKDEQRSLQESRH